MSIFAVKGLRRKRLSAAVLASTLMLPAGLATALGLGEISVNSELNQPLDGKITLSNLGSYEASDIRVKLASLADFERSGVDMTVFLTELKFEVEDSGNNNATISVTSRESVQEPYLNFVVEAYWPDGKVLREYTVLMDLPIYNAETVDTERFTAPKAEPTREIPPAPQRSSRFNPGLAGDKYTVGSNETLWGIARQVAPQGVSVQRTMIALQQNNPEAFRDNNINQLRYGAVLDIPSANQIQSLSEQAAIEEVKAQNQRWKNQPATKVPLDASRSASSDTQVGSAPDGRLSLASGGSSSSSSIGSSGSKANADLVVAREELDQQARENAELKARMTELQEQMGTLQTLIELKDDQIAQLQDQGGEAASQETATSAQDVNETSSATDTDTAPTEAVSDVEPEPAQVEEKPKKKPIVFEEPEEPSFLDVLMDNLTYILAALLAVVLGVYFLLSRRNKDEDEENDALLVPLDADDNFEVDDEAAAPEASPVVAQAQEMIDAHDTVGALALLEGAVGKEPHRSDIRLMLLEVLADNEMAKKFKIHYMGLKAIASDEDIAEADAILARTPGAENWLDVAEDSAVPASEKFPEMNYDDFDDGSETGDLDVEDIEDLDMSSISVDDDDVDLDALDSELTESSNKISGLEEDIDDEFSADLLATKEGGEGASSLPDLDEFLDDDDLGDDVADTDDELSLDDGEDLDFGFDDALEESDSELSLEDSADNEELSLDDDLALDDELTVADDLSVDTETADQTDELEDLGDLESLDDLDGLDDLDDLGDAGDIDFNMDGDDEFDLDGEAGEEDEVATRLELARAYVELGDEAGAKEILQEVVAEGSDEQKAEANSLLESL